MKATDPSMGPGRIVVRVPGLACRHDLRTVSAHLPDLDGVTALVVDLALKTVRVDGDVSVDAVRRAIAAAGYAVSDGQT